jgi:hypothetical protein
MAIAGRHLFTVFIFATVGLSLCTSAQAQKMFRCGSTYQDRPCEGATSGKTVRDFSQPADASSSPGQVADASCAKRGADAQQIAWARESGKTADAMASQATSEEQAKLIAEVYNRRGSALEVRNAVQAQCMEEKAQAARLAAMLSAALKAQGAATAGSGPTAAGATPNSAPTSAAAPPVQQTATADNKNRCASLNAQLASIRNRQRTGGTAKTMESLNQQRQEIESAARDAGC